MHHTTHDQLCSYECWTIQKIIAVAQMAV